MMELKTKKDNIIKLKVNKMELIKEIKKIKIGLGKVNTGINIKASKSIMMLTACDYTKQVFVQCPLIKAIEKTVDIVVDGILFANIITNSIQINAQEFELVINDTSMVIKLGDKFETTIGIKPKEEFIGLIKKDIKSDLSITMKTESFAQLILNSAYCAVVCEKEILKAINFTFDESCKMLMAATVGLVRVAISKTSYDKLKITTKGKEKEKNFLVEAQDIFMATKFLKGEKTEIRISDKFILLKGEDEFRVAIKRIHGDFPNASQFIPDNKNRIILMQVKKDELLNAINMSLSLVDRTKRKPAIYSVDKNNNVNLLSKSEKGDMRIGIETVQIENSEGQFDVAVNNSLFKEAITNMPAENIIINFYGKEKPIIIHPMDEKITESMGLVVPIRIAESDLKVTEEETPEK